VTSKTYYRKRRALAAIEVIIPPAPKTDSHSGIDLTHWEGNPEGFIREELGVKLITKEQREILDHFIHNRVTNVQAAHSVGKTFLMACIVLYWVFVVRGRAYSTAPSGDQVKELLWGEIRTLYDAHKHKLGGTRRELGVKLSETARAVGFSARNYDSNSFQGKHAQKLLLLQDEADGITEVIDDGFEACLTGSENRGIRVGNPLDDSTPFAKSCKISHIRIPVWSHPNVAWAYELHPDGIHRLKMEVAAKILKVSTEQKDDPVKPQEEWPPEFPRDVIPGAVSIRWIEMVRVKYGEDSVYWESRIEARFPTEVAEGIIPYSLLLKARQRYDSNPRYWDMLALNYGWVLGVDVGDKVDPHSIALWRGPVLYQVQLIDVIGDDEDTARLVDEIEKTVRRLGDARIAIDRIGVGAHVVADLKRKGYKVYPCIFGADAQDKSQFRNRKAELYWKFRDGLRLGTFAIAPLGEVEETVFEELRAVRYNTNTEKQIVCESKEQTKARLKRSPDGADGTVTALECEIVTIDTTAVVVVTDKDEVPSKRGDSITEVNKWFKD
jgi:hypothetical protein